MKPRELVIATRNTKKKRELETLLRPLRLRLLSLDDLKGIPRVRETGKTFDENAIKKALTVSRFVDKLVLADDSGLEVDALGGRPGVFSARFSGKGATNAKNIRKLLRGMESVPKQKRKARFRCSIALAKEGILLKVINGSCSGIIGFEPRGEAGFGYDPVFIVPRDGKTFAQLGPRTKNKISHRGKALRKAARAISVYFGRSL